MNEFYKVVQFLYEYFRDDQDTSTVTHGVSDMVDDQKKNIFPLVHLNIVSAQNVVGSMLFTFEISALNIRNESKFPITDKFLKNDNELDSLNICCAILNKFCIYLRNQNNEYDIETETLSEFTPVFLGESNGLDGWVMTVTLSIPNNQIDACTD